MHDMLPRKPTTAVAELKKSFMKDSLFGNGMNPSSASPALMSPAHSGGSSSPAQDEGINMKMRPDSPTHMIKDKMVNSTNCLPSMMPKPLTSSIVPATTTPPLSSPGHGPLSRSSSKSSPKQRRIPSADSRHRNQYFENMENNFCANNNNNSKQLQRRVVHKPDELTNRTPSRNSISDDISTSSLTPTTDEQTNSTSNQNLELSSILDGFNSDVFTKVFNDIPKDEDSQGMLFPDTNEGLKEFDAVITSFNKNNAGESIFDPSRTPSLDLDGALLDNLKDPLSPLTTKQLPVPNVSGSNISSPSQPFETKGQSRKLPPKSHLQDILGVTDTQRLENMSRPIDSVPYKSPTTTTSYSTGVKPTINQPCTMAPPSRHHTNITSPSFKPRPQFQFGNDGQMFRPNAHGFMDNGAWNRGSPRNIPPNMKSPSMNPSFVENTISPSGNVNPMSGLQSTVDSIPAAPSGSEPGTPTQFMPPPLSATPSPGGGRMRPPPSPSVTGDKRCTSADAVAVGNGGKRVAIKRERTKSADSKDEERKDPNAPKNKRRKSKSKEDAGKKPDMKMPGRGFMKDEKMPRHDSALTSLLNGQTNDPYVYIFSTDAANKAAEMVNAKSAPSIILCHQSFLGNRRISPSERYKPTITETKSEPTDTPTITMPTTCRSPTEILIEKSEPITLPLKSPTIEHTPVPVKAINLQDTKPPVLPLPETMNVPKIMKPDKSIPMPVVTSQAMDQSEMSAEKMRDRKNKLGMLKKLNQILFQGEPGGNPPGQPMQKGPYPPGWPGHPGPARYPSPMDKLQPGMKDMPDGMMGRIRPGMGPENAEWLHLVQEHQADKMRRHEAGIPGELASRPPPPYAPSQRYIVPDGYIPEPRMPMEHMGHPRMPRMGPSHRLLRMPQEARAPTGYMHPRMGMPRHYAPHPGQPQGQQQRMPMYDPYGAPPTMRHPSRLPHPGMRPPGENYPFSEQLMKQASYYNSVPPYDPESGGNQGEWSGPEGSQRLSHMPGSSSPAVGPQGQVLGPMDMNSRITPGVPNRQGFDSMGHYPGDVPHQRYDMLPPMGSPTNPMDVRLRGASMVDAMARRGGQRPPDLNLANQMPPRSPMNYPGHMASPSLAAMNHPVGPRFSNPGEMGHPPQQSPMLSRSPSVGMGQHLAMGPTSAGVEQQVMMGPVGPQSAGPMSNPPPNDWSGPGPVPGTPTANSAMIHHSMASQHGGMTSQQGMMPTQASMMPQQPPVMMSQPGMMGGQQTLQRVPSNPSSGKPGQSTLSLMMDRMNMFKMPDKSPLYQDAVKDTASPPPLTHQSEPPPLSHNPMPGTMRMGTPVHPPTYDTRMPHPHMGAHHESYPHPQGYPPSHPSPMPTNPMPGAPMMMNMAPDSIPPPSDFPQGQRGGFSEVTDFDLRNILPSERPSQTISYRPPDTNMPNQFSSPEWAGPDNMRSHMMSGPPHPGGPRMGMP